MAVQTSTLKGVMSYTLHADTWPTLANIEPEVVYLALGLCQSLDPKLEALNPDHKS